MAERKKTWDDQPDIVLEANVIGLMYLADGHSVEVLKRLDDVSCPWLLTVGTLFGSRTFECASPEAVLKMLFTAARSTRAKTFPPLPAGVAVLP